MKMTNLEIYSIAQAYNKAFEEFNEYLPVKVNFFMQKNKNTLMTAAQDIDNARMEIIQRYGSLNETGEAYIVPPESMDAANKELSDLFAIEQDIIVNKIDLSAFDNIKLTTDQVQAIMFMIDEEQV